MIVAEKRLVTRLRVESGLLHRIQTKVRHRFLALGALFFLEE